MKLVFISLVLIVLSMFESSTFTLSFDYAARANIPLTSSQLEVVWDNNIIFSVLPTDYLRNTVTVTVTVNLGQNVLSFAGSDKSDGYGCGIENVQCLE
jgi:hypothetical protein